ncbi:MAG: lytic transglycosylase domain-containing protein [Blastocatellia bacterium]
MKTWTKTWTKNGWLLFALMFFPPGDTLAQTISLDRQTLERARAYEPILIVEAARHGVDPRMLWVIAYLESRFRPQAVSPKGARGMMQMMPATAARFGARDPHDPPDSIGAAARYVRFLADRFGGRNDLILAAYNAGELTVEAYLTGQAMQAGKKVINSWRMVTGGVPPYRETQQYVARGVWLLRWIRQEEGTQIVSGNTLDQRQKQSVRGTKNISAASSFVEATKPVRLSISYFQP